MKLFYIFWLSCFLVGCGDNDEALKAVLAEYAEREAKGQPLKCPHCNDGWGLKFHKESKEDPIRCIYEGPHAPELGLDGGYVSVIDYSAFWESRGKAVVNRTKSISLFPLVDLSNLYDDDNHRFNYLLDKDKSYYSMHGCGKSFNFSGSMNWFNTKGKAKLLSQMDEKKLEREASELEAHELAKLERMRLEKKREQIIKLEAERSAQVEKKNLRLRELEMERKRREAAKSPEQRELEKITKELKALKEEVKKQNNKVPRRRIFP